MIISSHSIEHFTDPNHFFKIIKKVIKPNGKLFLELPNTPLTKDKYLKRPYDGSHLLYFNKNSLMKSVKMNKFKFEHIVTSGKKYPEIIEDMNNQFKLYQKKNRFKQFLKSCVKSIIPYKIYIKFRNFDLSAFEYGGSRWSIRSIIVNDIK